MDFNKIIKPLLGIAIIIIISAISIRLLTSQDTLMDYARDNPEIAYATASTTVAIEPIPEEEATTTVDGEDTTDMNNINDSFSISVITDTIKNRITGISYPADDSNIKINYDDLRYLTVSYYDFNGNVQVGEIICNKSIANDLIEIFEELYNNQYQIERIQLVDEYDGDDEKSMSANNTSCFNYRCIANSNTISNHALGLAIDINPFYNPYVVFGANSDGSDRVAPAGSETFCDRSLDFNHKIDKDDLCYKLFKAHGFSWGGDWKKSKDYQHFEKK